MKRSALILALSLAGALLFFQNTCEAESGTAMMLNRWHRYRDAMTHRRQPQPRKRPIWVNYRR